MPIVVPQIDATIPDGINDLDSFRRWARSDEFPERGRFAFLNGNFWLDLTMEMALSHNQVKGEFARVLMSLIKDKKLGWFFPDGMLYSNVEADFSTMPDGLFVSLESFERDAVKRFRNEDSDYVELVGTPDMVLEVVSKSSIEKDTVDLVDLYWRAGIPEYWLVDARSQDLRFDILRHRANGFEAIVKNADGWIQSEVFGRSFRFIRSTDRAGDPLFTLELH